MRKLEQLIAANERKSRDALHALLTAGTPCFDMHTHLPAKSEWAWGSPSFHSLGPHKIELIYKTISWDFEVCAAATIVVSPRQTPISHPHSLSPPPLEHGYTLLKAIAPALATPGCAVGIAAAAASTDDGLRERRGHADPDRLEALLEALLAADGLCSEW